MMNECLLERVFKFDGMARLRTVVVEWPILDKEGSPVIDAFGSPVGRLGVGFIAMDAAKILEYSHAGHAIRRHVAPAERIKCPVQDSRGKRQPTWVVSEAGLYELIFSSKMEDAKRLKHFVTHVVLPSVRRYGAYISPEVLAQTATDNAAMKRLTEALKGEIAYNESLLTTLEAARPMMAFYTAVGNAENCISMGDMAKILSNAGFLKPSGKGPLGRNTLYAYLRQWGYLCTQPSSYNSPYAQSMAKGWFKIKEKYAVGTGPSAQYVIRMVMVTGKGQTGLLELFTQRAKKGQVKVDQSRFDAYTAVCRL